MDLEATDASPLQNPKQMDEEFTIEEELGKTNVEAEVQSMVSVPIHQDTSSVPSMTTLVIDLTMSQSGSPLPTSSATTSKCIDELQQHMENLLQYNLALEERLDKYGSWLYKLENLNIPHQVSKAVDEIVTDAVDWAMQALLRAHFSDLLAVDMKEILQQSGRSSLEERKRRDIPRTPFGSPPSQPPPPPPPVGTSGAPGNKAPSLSKSTAITPQSMAWTTSDTRYESASLSETQELSPMDSLIPDDCIPNE
nr:hypothetical protein [Tanacetum cinerariifolium]